MSEHPISSDFIVCPICHRPHPRTARFCSVTGKAIPMPEVGDPEADEAEPSQWEVAQEKEPRSAIEQPGQTVEETTQAMGPPVEEPIWVEEPPDEAVAPEEAVLFQPAEEATILCPYCGQRHSTLADFCPETGWRLGEAALVCPECSTMVEPDWLYCPNCHTSLQDRLEKKNWRKLLLLLGVLVIVLMAVFSVSAWLLWNNGDQLVSAVQTKYPNLPLISNYTIATQALIAQAAASTPSAFPVSALATGTMPVQAEVGVASETSATPPPPTKTRMPAPTPIGETLTSSPTVPFSLTYGAVNKPCIAYYDMSNGDLKFVCQGAYGYFLTPKVLDAAGDVGKLPSLVFGSSGAAQISYYDLTHKALKYVRETGSSWSQPSVVALNTGANSSLVLDRDNQPLIAYVDAGDRLVRLARLGPEGWTHEDVASVSKIDDLYLSLIIDPAGNPWVLYNNSGTGEFWSAHWDGKQWETARVDDAEDVGYYNSVALNSSNEPCVSYYDRKFGFLKYAYWNGTVWIPDYIDRSGDVGIHSSIVIDQNSNTYISYLDDDNDDLKLIVRTGTHWGTPIRLDPNLSGDYSSIALDSSGNPYVSYFVFNKNDLKIAYRIGGAWSYNVIDSTGDVGYDSVIKIRPSK